MFSASSGFPISRNPAMFDGIVLSLPSAGVDERRRSVGLLNLAERAHHHFEAAAQTNEPLPDDWHARRRKMDEWVRKVGWRD